MSSGFLINILALDNRKAASSIIIRSGCAIVAGQLQNPALFLGEERPVPDGLVSALDNDARRGARDLAKKLRPEARNRAKVSALPAAEVRARAVGRWA